MKFVFAILFIIFGPCVLAQTVSTSGQSALYVGNGTGKALAVFQQPDAQGKCRTSAASAPGTFMCKEAIVTKCAAPAASSVQTVACASPLVGSYQVTTTYAMSAACVQTSVATPARSARTQRSWRRWW